MKKLMILTVAILLAGAGTGYAQPQDANSRKMARKQMKATGSLSKRPGRLSRRRSSYSKPTR